MHNIDNYSTISKYVHSFAQFVVVEINSRLNKCLLEIQALVR